MNDNNPIEATVVFVLSTDPATGEPVVLLGRKSPRASFAAGKLVPPGGKCLSGESYLACAARECLSRAHVYGSACTECRDDPVLVSGRTGAV